MAMRMRSGLSLLRRSIVAASPSAAAERFVGSRAVVSSGTISSEFTRNYADAPASKQQKVKVPVTMFGVSGNYASALYIAAVKVNVLDTVESELLSLVEASKKSPTFTQFMKDASITKDTRAKAITDICNQAKFSDITKNFMAVVAEAGRLGHLERMVQRFSELTMAHRGEVKVTVTTVIPLPAEEEKELIETLQDILGQGKKAKVDQKIDPSILGGLVVEFGQKVFDMSIRTRARQMERFLRQPTNLDAL
ncbi:delta subunit of Mt ATP synthase [Perilla frutescens var. hirtella]|uniref:Delta subunit of Mt ATP synthase n=1 Tax=Perilla frutescens var. hirtella TaxID=608512 RepID=A0AAD4P2Q5_PERFH|nr:delta subunit of Mt ATP synthase [Perilla frutescens var. hirtella]